MGPNLKDDETVALVTEVAKRLGTNKTGAVRQLAREKLSELDSEHDADNQARREENLRWLEGEVWPKTAGKHLTRDEVDDILGYNSMVPE
jgi:hypothetical protein